MMYLVHVWNDDRDWSKIIGYMLSCKKCSGIKGPLRPDPEFRYARCLGTARAIDEREVSEVEVGNEKLEVVPEFCYLGDMLSAGGGCDHTLQTCMGQVLPIASPSHQPPSAPSDQR